MAGNPATRRWTVVVAGAFGLMFGYGMGVLAPALPSLARELGLGVGAQSTVVGAALVAALIAALVGGQVAEHLGRRASLLLIAGIVVVGSALSAAAPGPVTLIGGRALLGCAIGGSSFVAPMYLAEVTPTERRGRLVSLNQLMITGGLFLAALLGALLAPGGYWRVLVALAALPALAVVVPLASGAIPESPRWLWSRGRLADAARAGEVLGLDGYEEEPPSAAPPPGWRLLLAPAHRRLVGVGLTIAVAVHLTGLDMAVYFAPTILTESGLGLGAATLGGAVVAAANLAMTLLTVAVIDRVGRRVLFIGGVAIMAVAAGVLGALYRTGIQAGPAVVSALAMFIAAAAAGPAGVFWTYVAELYPQRIRSTALGATAAGHWAADAAVASSFLSLVAATSLATVFWGYSVISVAVVAFCAVAMPETRGRALGDALGRARRAVGE